MHEVDTPARLVLNAVHHQEILFSRPHGESGTGVPLWVKLISNGDGLRLVSKDWRRNADRLLAALGRKDSAAISADNISDPQHAYRLAQFELAKSLMTGRRAELSECERLYLHWRISLRCLPDGELPYALAGARASKLAKLDWLSVLASYGVRMARTNPRELPQILQELTKEVDAIAALLDGNVQILRLAHLFNSINFMCLMRQEYDEVERNLRFTEDVLLPGLLSCEGYKHILGNFYFHRSIMSKMSDDTENERSFLMRAIEEDYGYSDYYYRVAQIYHDQGKSEARCYYEKGLSCSPFDDGVVNDYGCLLKEQGDEVALESWTRVGQGVFG